MLVFLTSVLFFPFLLFALNEVGSGQKLPQTIFQKAGEIGGKLSSNSFFVAGNLDSTKRVVSGSYIEIGGACAGNFNGQNGHTFVGSLAHAETKELVLTTGLPTGVASVKQNFTCKHSLAEVVGEEKYSCNSGYFDTGTSCVATNWHTSGFGGCSVTCGGGTQTQTVYCKRNDTNAQIADSYCTGTKPITSQSCNTQSCCASNQGQICGTEPGYCVNACVIACGGCGGSKKAYYNGSSWSCVTSGSYTRDCSTPPPSYKYIQCDGSCR